MRSESNPLSSSIQRPSQGGPAAKLHMLAQLMRALSATYAVWVLWKIVTWWTDVASVRFYMGRALDRDLSGMATSQSFAAMGADLAAWAILVAAVVYCWKFLACLSGPDGFNEQAASFLARCAWLGLTCQICSVLIRPVTTAFLTMHLPPQQMVWRWQFQTADLQGVILCLALLMFTYLFTWAIEIAKENRSFV
jgi:hypothetical protein